MDPRERLLEDARALEEARLAGLVTDEEYARRSAEHSQRAAEIDESLGNRPGSLVDLEVALHLGADCAQLFELRNAMDPKDPDKATANELLRQVGCYSPNSTRREPAP